MATTDRRPQLPALSYLDVDSIDHRSDDDASPKHRVDSAMTTSDLKPTMTTPPDAHRTRAATPPYTSHSTQLATTATASNWRRGGDGYGAGAGARSRTVSDPRHEGREELPHAKHGIQHSLPSIASITGSLQMETPSSYPRPPTSAATTHVVPPASIIPQKRSEALTASPPAKRTYLLEHMSPAPYASIGGGSDHYPPRPQPPPETSFSTSPYAPQEHRAPPFAAAPAPTPASAPALDARASLTSQPPSHPPGPYVSASSTSAHPDQLPHLTSAPMPPPPPAPHSYYHHPYSARHPSSTAAAPPNSSGTAYPPSSQFAAPPSPAQSSWKSEGGQWAGRDDRSAGPAYSDNVKRHLEIFDLEAAFAEISQSSHILLDFSRRYGEYMQHQTAARAGPSLSTLPSMVEMEDMLSKTRAQLDSLLKIRGVIVQEQAAYELQLADQRAAAAAAAAIPAPPAPHQPPLSKPLFFSEPGAGPQKSPLSYSKPTSHISDPSQHPPTATATTAAPPSAISASSAANTAAILDAKKRRGRAAPPGRCHSCNRAETPEWRRGPDGARTLCNACGLHYAKLTRKHASAMKAAGQSNSGSAAGTGASGAGTNLRPKE